RIPQTAGDREAEGQPQRRAGRRDGSEGEAHWKESLCRSLYRPRLAIPAALVFVLVLILIFILAVHFPSAITARITRLEGSAVINRGGQPRPATAGLTLRWGDRLQLASNAFLTVTYPRDGTWFRLSDSAIVQIGFVAQSLSSSESMSMSMSMRKAES